MKAILTFQGFTESESNRSGTEDLFFDVIRNFAGRDVTTYHPRTWTTNVRHLAEQLMRQNIRHVAIVSYSHGQAAATAFARLAYDYGLKVDLWLACDPVYRPTWAPRNLIGQLLSFRAIIGNPKIRVPHGVRRVASVQQTLTKPCGHQLFSNHPNTYIQKPLTLPYGHTGIDSAPEWFALVKSELRQWCQPLRDEPT